MLSIHRFSKFCPRLFHLVHRVPITTGSTTPVYVQILYFLMFSNAFLDYYYYYYRELNPDYCLQMNQELSNQRNRK